MSDLAPSVLLAIILGVAGIAAGQVSRENPYTKPGTELYLTPAAFEELLDVIQLADDAEDAARAAYHQYQDAYDALVPKILEDIANAGQDEIDAIRREYWDGRQKRGVIVTEDDHERIELESRLYREMRKKIDEEVDLRHHILLGQMRGNRRCIALFDALLAELKERCEHDDCDARLERAARIGRRRMFSDQRRVNRSDFTFPDLAHILEDAQAPGEELFEPYDRESLVQVHDDPDRAAAWAALRWEIDQALQQYELEADVGIQRRLWHVTTPPVILPFIRPRHELAARLRAAYDRFQNGVVPIERSIREHLGQDRAIRWQRRVERSIAPRLMREFWIESPLDEWLRGSSLAFYELEQVREVVASARSRLDAHRTVAFDVGLQCVAQHGLLIGSAELHRRYKEVRQRVVDVHDDALAVILKAVHDVNAVEGQRLADSVRAARNTNYEAFGHLYTYP